MIQVKDCKKQTPIAATIKFKEKIEGQSIPTGLHKRMDIDKNNHHVRHPPFIYESNTMNLVFPCISDDYVMKCPMCHIETKYIIQHISRKKDCMIYGDIDSFKNQFQVYKKDYTAKVKQMNYLSKREQDNEKYKEDQRKRKEMSRIKQRQEDNEKVKEQQRKHQEASRIKQREEDNDKVKEQQRKHQEASMIKQREEDNEKVKEQQRKHYEASRIKQKEKDT